MRLRRGSGDGSSGAQEPRRSPEPEGPEGISERVLRERHGASKRLASRLRKEGEPQKKLSIAVAAAQLALVGIGLFAELPTLWLIAGGTTFLTFLFHHEGGEDKSRDETATEPGYSLREGRGADKRRIR